MANKQYLDKGGLERVWDRIKSYLTTWKTTNFGSGTYTNSGSLTISSSGSVTFGDSNELIVSMRRGIIKTYNFCIDFSGSEILNDTSIDTSQANVGMAMLKFTMQKSHKIEFTEPVDYAVITKEGVNSGFGSWYRYEGDKFVFILWSKA